jgi:hypothetical protein
MIVKQNLPVVWTWLVILLFTMAAAAQDINISGYEMVYNDLPAPYLLDVWTVPDNFVNTGISFDPSEHIILSAHYEPSLIGECVEFLRKSDGAKVAPPLYVNAFTAVLQGLALDTSDWTYWLWSGDCPYSQKRAVHFTGDGTELPDGFPMPGYPGMLSYDPVRDGLWSKESDDSAVLLYSCSDGSVIDFFDAGFDGEGIALDPFDGTFWGLTREYVYHVERNGSSAVVLGTWDNPSRFYPPDTTLGYFSPGEAEGIVVDPSDRTLWFNADQGFHGGIPGGNRCWHINPLETYDLSVLVPGGMTWEKGLHEDTEVRGNRLWLVHGVDRGTFTCPVVDLGGYSLLVDTLDFSGEGTVTLEYRGSDTSPDLQPLTNLTLPYYDANGINAGWGGTAPCSWSDSVPTVRYLQVRFLIERDVSHCPGSPGSGTVSLRAAPVPFRGQLELFFDLPVASKVILTVFDLSGRRVAMLADGILPAGDQLITWNPDPSHPDGCYLIVLDACGERVVTRCVLLR